MLQRLSHIRLLRFVGMFTWALVGCWLLNLFFDPEYLKEFGDNLVWVTVLPWLLCFLAFGVGYWWLTHDVGMREPRLRDHVILFQMTLCAIGVSYFSETSLGSVMLMVLAGLLPWLLPMPVGLAWILLGSLAFIPLFAGPMHVPLVLAIVQALLYVGFSGLVFTTAYVAKQQASARDEQRRVNAELRATRALLAQSAQINERTRISRELHDLLGHHLTALSLNLEVAGHITEGRAQEHVHQAHTLAKLLLTDVREAVSQLRDSGAIDLAAALRPLAEQVPALQIHLQVEEPLTVEDPARAHVLLRCTQEIITNTVRHAQADNLWIQVRREGPLVVIQARDDGRGCATLLPGNGLCGMRERLSQYGGNLEIDAPPGVGFRLRAAVPSAAALLPPAVPQGVLR
ncbi:sensor histidine kinase [Xanthomonas theicola]|uniref:Two-component sensor histidine kinase n=1 Tax=Xanthomonas theicola TaxID=56464 RepID=A0A2S6ZFA8_9XANT|nr:sensor histidine kinase [Xanthomonas theicola]PPT90933.1 two-component sensor histidine kinase [Xanthomonas theicola]QNH23611.1 sensor histidine kinase [Xanthomonas theicola]